MLHAHHVNAGNSEESDSASSGPEKEVIRIGVLG